MDFQVTSETIHVRATLIPKCTLAMCHLQHLVYLNYTDTVCLCVFNCATKVSLESL